MTTPKLSKDVTIYHCSENVRLSLHLKGQCHEIFDFWFFSWISFPLSPKYTIRAVSIFFFFKICGDIHSSRCATGVVDTGINNTSETGGKICRRCRWYRWCTLTCEYLRKFSKKFKTVLMGYSGAGWKLIHEKNQKQKISWHGLFNPMQVGTWDVVRRASTPYQCTSSPSTSWTSTSTERSALPKSTRRSGLPAV